MDKYNELILLKLSIEANLLKKNNIDKAYEEDQGFSISMDDKYAAVIAYTEENYYKEHGTEEQIEYVEEHLSNPVYDYFDCLNKIVETEIKIKEKKLDKFLTRQGMQELLEEKGNHEFSKAVDLFESTKDKMIELNFEIDNNKGPHLEFYQENYSLSLDDSKKVLKTASTYYNKLHLFIKEETIKNELILLTYNDEIKSDKNTYQNPSKVINIDSFYTKCRGK